MQTDTLPATEDATRTEPKREAVKSVIAKYSTPVASGCIEWIGTRDRDGYGIFRIAKKRRFAHKAAFECTNGPVPSGLELDHLCRNRACINPAHLEAVTHAENMRRGMSPMAQNARKTHCNKGHELAGDNLYVKPSTGARQCNICRRAQQRAKYEANPEFFRAKASSFAKAAKARPVSP